MIVINKESITQRFMRYAELDTQSDPQSHTFPSTTKQKVLSLLLVAELKEAGLNDAQMDEYGYVYATLPANSKKGNVPAICFCSHVDTAPDCSGTNVKPILHKNYQGQDIALPDDSSQVLTIKDYPYLKGHTGSDIITASGTTLLGADDKSGVAVIMEAAEYLLQNPELKHGEIKLLFTPDEEIGKGTAMLDIRKLKAKFAYTLDGGEAGSLEDETFNADGATLTIQGIMAHPGYAKGKLVNALKVAADVLHALPKNEWCPEATENKDGFVHAVHLQGNAETATVEFIIRDFDTGQLKSSGEKLKQIADQVIGRYPGAAFTFVIHEQYRNMKQILDGHPQVIEYACEAIKRAGLRVSRQSIRGGTDGSRLSFMGLPCANIFTGMQAIHSKLEWIGVKDMIKSAETLVHLSMIWEERS